MSTIKEIAKRANVSIGTVDRALHDRGRVSDETKAKIMEIAKEIGYSPNLFARNLKTSKTYHFGVMLPFSEQDNGYWEFPLKGIKRAEAELEIFKTEISYFHYDKFSEESAHLAFQQMIAGEPDGVLIAPSRANVFEALVQSIPENIPYVFINSSIPNTNYLAYIGQNAYQSGFLSGKLMSVLVDKPNIAVVKYLPDDYHLNNRVNGFLDFYKNTADKNIVVFAENPMNFKNGAEGIAEKIYKEFNDVEGIYVSNAVTFPIAKFFKENKLSHQMKIIGYDLIDGNLKYLRDGTIDFLISQNSTKQGYEGIYSLFNHLFKKQEVTKDVYLPLDILTKENIEYFKK